MNRHSKRPAPTLQDVATRAGVSTATVSRALNHPDAVTETLRARVDEAVSETGYVRHGVARALASSKSFTIGIIIPTLDSAIFASGVNAMEGVLREAGYNAVLSSNSYDLERETQQVRKLIEQGVDGMVLVGRDHRAETIDLLQRHDCPFVCTWAFSPDFPFPCVGFDNAAASAMVADLLVGLGHGNLAMIAGLTEGNDRARERVAGFRAALASHDIALPDANVIECRYDLDEGRRGLRALWNRPDADRPTAIFCGNDVLAAGAVLEARDIGIRVPEDLAIVGFDDLEIARCVAPALTTVRVPSADMGARAAQCLLAEIDGSDGAVGRELQVHIVRRDSA